jgi:pyruvate,orthophosphate dikinase
MPGMMDTVLNLGLNDETVEALAARSGDRRFAYDSYRRFIQMYADVVLGRGSPRFRGHPGGVQGRKRLRSRHRHHRRPVAKLISRFKALVEEELEKPFPQDPHEQLWGAIGAVFQVLAVERARHHLPQAQRHSG